MLSDSLKDIFKQASESEKDMQVADRALNMVGDMARKCLDNPEFVQYRREFEKRESILVDTMITYTQNFVEGDKGDSTKYTLNMVRLFTRLQTFRALLKGVKADALKQVKKDTEEKVVDGQS